MAASEAAVTAVMETLRCRAGFGPYGHQCIAHLVRWTDRGCPVAVAAADAAVDADRASIQAQTLLLAAMDLEGGLGVKGIPHVLYDFRLWLRARADRIEAQP